MTDDTLSPPMATRWLAKGPTYVKASETFSGDLPDREKYAVKAGAELAGLVAEENTKYWIVSDGTVDGDPLPSHIRFLYKPNWTVISAPPVEIEEPSVTPEATPPGPHEDRVSIRAYELWEQDGRPDNRSDDYWHRAASELGHVSERTGPA